MSEVVKEIEKKLNDVFQIRTGALLQPDTGPRVELLANLLYLYDESWRLEGGRIVVGSTARSAQPSGDQEGGLAKPMKKLKKWLALAELGHLARGEENLVTDKRLPRLVTGLMDRLEHKMGQEGVRSRVRAVAGRRVSMRDTALCSPVPTPAPIKLQLPNPTPASVSIPTGRELARTPPPQGRQLARTPPPISHSSIPTPPPPSVITQTKPVVSTSPLLDAAPPSSRSPSLPPPPSPGELPASPAPLPAPPDCEPVPARFRYEGILLGRELARTGSKPSAAATPPLSPVHDLPAVTPQVRALNKIPTGHQLAHTPLAPSLPSTVGQEEETVEPSGEYQLSESAPAPLSDREVQARQERRNEEVKRKKREEAELKRKKAEAVEEKRKTDKERKELEALRIELELKAKELEDKEKKLQRRESTNSISLKRQSLKSKVQSNGDKSKPVFKSKSVNQTKIENESKDKSNGNQANRVLDEIEIAKTVTPTRAPEIKLKKNAVEISKTVVKDKPKTGFKAPTIELAATDPVSPLENIAMTNKVILEKSLFERKSTRIEGKENGDPLGLKKLNTEIETTNLSTETVKEKLPEVDSKHDKIEKQDLMAEKSELKKILAKETNELPISQMRQKVMESNIMKRKEAVEETVDAERVEKIRDEARARMEEFERGRLEKRRRQGKHANNKEKTAKRSLEVPRVESKLISNELDTIDEVSEFVANDNLSVETGSVESIGEQQPVIRSQKVENAINTTKGLHCKESVDTLDSKDENVLVSEINSLKHDQGRIDSSRNKRQIVIDASEDNAFLSSDTATKENVTYKKKKVIRIGRKPKKSTTNSKKTEGTIGDEALIVPVVKSTRREKSASVSPELIEVQSGRSGRRKEDIKSTTKKFKKNETEDNTDKTRTRMKMPAEAKSQLEFTADQMADEFPLLEKLARRTRKLFDMELNPELAFSASKLEKDTNTLEVESTLQKKLLKQREKIEPKENEETKVTTFVLKKTTRKTKGTKNLAVESNDKDHTLTANEKPEAKKERKNPGKDKLIVVNEKCSDVSVYYTAEKPQEEQINEPRLKRQCNKTYKDLRSMFNTPSPLVSVKKPKLKVSKSQETETEPVTKEKVNLGTESVILKKDGTKSSQTGKKEVEVEPLTKSPVSRHSEKEKQGSRRRRKDVNYSEAVLTPIEKPRPKRMKKTLEKEVGILSKLKDEIYKTPSTRIDDEVFPTPLPMGAFNPVSDEQFSTPQVGEEETVVEVTKKRGRKKLKT